MSSDRIRENSSAFNEKFDQKLQEVQKLRNNPSLRVEDSKSMRSDRANAELKEKLEKLRQENEYYRRLYELLTEQGSSESTKLILVSREYEKEIRRLRGLLDQANTYAQALTQQLQEQQQSNDIEILRGEVRNLNETIEKISQSSNRAENPDRRDFLRLQRENEELRKRLTRKTESIYQAGTPRGNRDRASSFQGNSRLDDVEDSGYASTSREDLIQELKSQNATLNRHLQETNRRFQEQIQKFNSYIDKLPKSKEVDKSSLKTMFKNMSLYFYDFTKQRQKYQQKIIDLLKQIARLRNLLTTNLSQFGSTELQLWIQSGLYSCSFH